MAMAASAAALLAPAFAASSSSPITFCYASFSRSPSCLSNAPLRSFHGGLLSLERRQLSKRQEKKGVKLGSTVAQASDSDSSSTLESAAAVGGLVSVPVVAWSLYTLKTTGCGLPPGPGGSLGALEGVAYLAIVGVVGWSAYTKVKTGSGLPNGPFGLLGAAEGLAYLTLLAAIVVFGLQILDYGYIPPPVPGEQCFG